MFHWDPDKAEADEVEACEFFVYIRHPLIHSFH